MTIVGSERTGRSSVVPDRCKCHDRKNNPYALLVWIKHAVFALDNLPCNLQLSALIKTAQIIAAESSGVTFNKHAHN